LNRESFFDVVAACPNTKLFCTHACFDAVNLHPRNLTEKQVEAIVHSDGLIGLTFVDKFLTRRRRAQIHDVFAHIAWLLKEFGNNNIAIGTDFFGCRPPRRLRHYHELVNLEQYLLENGISQDTVDKIFYKNAERFFGR
jgi:membrane dipeptidase